MADALFLAIIEAIPHDPGNVIANAVMDAVKAQSEQVGWVRWDGDEYHDFRYKAPGDEAMAAGYLPVFVVPERTGSGGRGNG